jgi:hypothetical protein
MANLVYNSFKVDIQKEVINLETDTIKMMLVTSAYVPNIDTHSKRSDVTNEVVGAGYTAGGFTLANKTLTQNNTNNTGVWDADDIVAPAITLTDCAGAVLYKSRGGLASADELIYYLEFPSPITMTNGTLTIPFNASGISTLGQI